jgi:SAM-dependent methyltransferase
MYHVPVRSPSDARQQVKGRIMLAHCADCGHIFNQLFDRALINYNVDYDNTQHHSPTFMGYMTTLARELVETLGVRNKVVLEIGCGNGSFLSALCSQGNNYGFGFDPSYRAGAGAPIDPRVRIIGVDYDAAFQGCGDLVCARHVLEHIDRPVSFMRDLVRLMAPQDGAVLIEVPNGSYIIENNGIWDILYEHASNFSRLSIRRLFGICGLRPIFVEKRFGGQFIAAVGQRQGSRAADLGSGPTAQRSPSDEMVRNFGKVYEAAISSWCNWLRAAACRGERICLWGAGTKAITFLNLVTGPDRALQAAIAGVIDINPGKNGRFIPGTGHPVLAPENLAELRPDAVVVMNPIYENEIRQMVGDILHDDVGRVRVISINENVLGGEY